MSKKIELFFISSEVSPFSKTGGLADVSYALPKELQKQGINVSIFTPKYAVIDDNKYNLQDVPNSEFQIQIGEKLLEGKLKSLQIEENLKVYFVVNDHYYGRSGLYVDPVSNSDYSDNMERFIFFSRGILEAAKKINLKPHIIHCNDWQTGLIPVYLKTLYSEDPFYNKTKSIYTIHNLAYQGIFDKSEYYKIGLSWEFFSIDGFEFYDRINFMKAGIIFADKITTVSEKYAEEICSSVDYGYGLEGVLKNRKSDLYGILNGVDYTNWSPSRDKYIPKKYNSRELTKKILNKKELLKRFNLPFDENIPTIGIISRLADQKGFDLIEAAADELMQMPLQLVVLGVGEQKFQNFLERLGAQYPEKVGIYIGFSEELAHLIEAGSDMFLMPSRYEPCGLNQLYSLKYGTVPIVRATGGLDDSIVQFNRDEQSGTGFKFYEYNRDTLLNAVKLALEIFKDKTLWKKLMINGMKQDFSWRNSAKKYVKLYKNLIK